MYATNKLIVSGNSRVYNKGKEHMTQRAGESGLLLWREHTMTDYELLVIVLMIMGLMVSRDNHK